VGECQLLKIRQVHFIAVVDNSRSSSLIFFFGILSDRKKLHAEPSTIPRHPISTALNATSYPCKEAAINRFHDKIVFTWMRNLGISLAYHAQNMSQEDFI
jgi:hypothetical protein